MWTAQTPPLLQAIRANLIRQEETIIFALIERAQFLLNPAVYEQGAILPPPAPSFLWYFLRETEVVHARVRRYTCPEEQAFTDDLPAPILRPLLDHSEIMPNDISVNDQIYAVYLQDILPSICASGDDGNYGSSATCDVAVLQALSKRIHYGKFVAEAKFSANPDAYIPKIRARDRQAIVEELRAPEVEDRVVRRIERKAATYGRDAELGIGQESCKVSPQAVAQLYREQVIPLTIEVEVLYLFGRLES